MAEKEVKTKKAKKAPEEMTWKDIELGCAITEPGTAAKFRTGDWKSAHPVWDKSKCNPKCALCATYCPEGCIKMQKDGYFEADLYYCKGCGICAEECRRQAITMVEE